MQISQTSIVSSPFNPWNSMEPTNTDSNMKLPLADYRRFGRQMILEGFGLSGQLSLRQSSVLVVGAGGLGCPALQYLAAAGVGRIGIIDHDTVEVSNLQRQILHNEQTVGMSKVDSATLAIKRINSGIKVESRTEYLAPATAASILKDYDVILDCSDNAPTRYLLSDTAVALGKPLVSGAAQMFEGQVCVYNKGPKGLCYRCLFPEASAQSGTCEELGILGVVTGIIGNLQALEAIKIITDLNMDDRNTMTVFSAKGQIPFRTIDLGSKDPYCPACGTLGERLGDGKEFDYVQFCGGPRPDWEKDGLVEGEAGTRISVQDFSRKRGEGTPIKVIDVRPQTEFEICSLPGSMSVPLDQLTTHARSFLPFQDNVETIVLCRLGNDSQIAVDALRREAKSLGRTNLEIRDVIGGLRAWSMHVDNEFPIY